MHSSELEKKQLNISKYLFLNQFIGFMKKLFGLAFYFLFYVKVSAQFYSTGEPPFSIKWNSIQTPHFKVIYPRENTNQAERMANLLEFYYPLCVSDLNPVHQKKIPVILHNSSVISNGYVTWAPWRMELVLTPPQDSWSENWLNQLAVHETRHTVQLNMLNTGFTRGLKILTGQIGPGLVSAEIPQWLYEGDAVYAETAFSNSGRGRLPSFSMPLRALLLKENSYYSYNKFMFGSYRDFVPDHYLYGYQLASHGQRAYNNIWQNTFKTAGKYPFLFSPVTVNLKKKTGLTKSKFYMQTLDALKNLYINDIEHSTYTDYKSISPINRTYTQYILPHQIAENQIVCMRYGLSDAGSMVLMDSTGNILKLKPTGYAGKIKSSVFKNLVVWDEIVTDPRWQSRSYSVIRIWDVHSGKIRNLTHRSRYFSPDFSPDGHTIAVVEIDLKMAHSITILDAFTGKRIGQYPLSSEAVITPEWINENEIAYISVGTFGKQLEILNLTSGTSKVILPYTYDNISKPIHYKGNILFRSSRSGIENIYSVSLSDPTMIRQVTRSAQGAFYPSASGEMLLFSEYSSNGSQIKQTMLDSTQWTRWSDDSVHLPGPPVTHIMEDTGVFKSYPEKRHSKLRLLRIHSWLPFYTDMGALLDDPTEISILPGLTIFSQNELNTLISSIGYGFDDGYHIIKPSFQWRGWYPIVEFEGQIDGPQMFLGNSGEVNIHQSTYNEFILRSYIPWLFQHGKSYTSVRPELEYEWSSIFYETDGSIHKGIAFYHLKLHASNFHRAAPRDIYPRWGQSIAGAYTRSLADIGLFGDMFSLKGSLYFPGIMRHQNFIIRGGYQLQNPENYYLPFNRIDFPRGYTSAVSREIKEISLNYSFPFAYPDWGLGPVIYIKRLRANAFYDLLYAKDLRGPYRKGSTSYNGSIYSYGTEVLADFHAFRIVFPVSAGIRIGATKNQSLFSEFVINIQASIL